tara:strand:- start:684 stop:1157 length:474 start_codon:yes stop_codon:yes gene_type:complete
MFCTDVKDKRIIDAVKAANIIFRDSEFLQLIGNHEGFDMSTTPSAQIAFYLETTLELDCIEVKLFRPKWPWSKVYAMFKSREPRSIYLSSRRLNRDEDAFGNMCSIVGSIAHEYVHLVDNRLSKHSFGHGNNDSRGKGNTAPYRIGELAKWFIYDGE